MARPIKNQAFGAFAAALAVGLGVFIFMAVRGVRKQAQSTPASVFAGTEGSAAPAPKAPLPATSTAPDDTRPRLELSNTAIEEFLESRGRNTAALVAVYHHTKNLAYRSELEERALVDPDAAVALAVFDYCENRWVKDADDRESGATRVKSLEKARASFPNDVILSGILAGTESVLGRHAVALSLLGDNSNRQSIRNASVARQQAMRALMVAGGLDEQRAWVASSKAEGEFLFAISAMINPLAASINKVARAPLDDQIETVSRIATLSKALNPYEDVSGINAVVARSLESLALRTIPAETGYGVSGATVAERLVSIKKEEQRDAQLQKRLTALLQKADAQTIQGFLEKREQFGHPIAVQWMEQQIVKGK